MEPRGEKAEPRPALLSERLGPQGDTVLIIDDNATAREALRQLLTRQGFRAEAAASGAEGLRLARELRPSVILLDVVMPGMDGISVLAALRADPELATVPVVMFTGMVNDRTEAFRLGASDYMMKPIDLDRLTVILRRFCGCPAC